MNVHKLDTLAEKAVRQFAALGLIPNLGQRTHEGIGPGSVHVFRDGSVAVLWDDGEFSVGELQEENP